MADKPLYFKTRRQWRRWLEKNHAKKKEAWLLYYKKNSGKKSVSYEKAVEEALCFGWIDTTVRSLDGKSFMQKYTPRNPGSVWSLLNKRRALKMIRESRMAAAGFAKVRAAKKSRAWYSAYTLKKEAGLPADLKKALEKNRRAWENFKKFLDGARNFYVLWVEDAKLKETRRRRIGRVVDFASRDIKYGMAGS